MKDIQQKLEQEKKDRDETLQKLEQAESLIRRMKVKVIGHDGAIRVLEEIIKNVGHEDKSKDMKHASTKRDK